MRIKDRFMRTAIIDDDPLAIKFLREEIKSNFFFLDLVGTASNVDEGISLIRNKSPQLLFLDVMLGSNTCFDILKEIEPKNYHIIFTTSHKSFAIKAFDYNAVHYLVKPIDTSVLKEAIKRVYEHHTSHVDINQLANEILHDPNLAIPNKNGTEFIPQRRIFYCKGSGNYTELFLENGDKRIVSKPISWVEEKMKNSFFRVHKRYLINLHEVNFLEKGKHTCVYLNNGAHITVSLKYKSDLVDRLSQQ